MAGNVSLLLGGKAIAGLVSTIYIVIVTRVLGPRDFGTLVLVNSWAVTVGGIIAFSGWHAIVRYGAQALADGDTPRLMRLARFMTLVELGCGAAAILIAFLFAPVAGQRLGWSPEIIGIARVYSIAIIANILTTPHGILQLAGRFDRLGVHPALSPLMRLAGTVVVWLGGGGLAGFLIVWMVSAVSEGLAMWALAWPVFRTLRGNEPLAGPVRGTVGENAGLTRFLLTTNADLTLRDLAPKLVPLIVGATLGPAATGIYSLSGRAALILQQPAIQLSQAAYPAVAKLLAEGERQKAIRMTWRTSGIALLITVPLVVLLAFFSKQILQLMGGRAFGDGAFLFILLTVGRAALLGAVPISSALIALGRTGASIAVNLVTNLGMLPLLPLALTLFGLTGAGWFAILSGVSTLVALAMVFRAGKAAPPPLDPALAAVAPTDDPRGLSDG